MRKNVQDNFIVPIINRKSIFIICPVLTAEPITFKPIDTMAFNNFVSGPFNPRFWYPSLVRERTERI